MSYTGCRYVRDKLFDYLDGNLDNRIAASVEAHLASCQACRKELERCRASLAMLASAKVEPPADFTARVMARIAADNSEKENNSESKAKILRSKKIFTRRFGTYVAAAVLVAAIAVGWRVLPAFMQKAGTADFSSAQDKAAAEYKGAAPEESMQETLSALDTPDISGGAEPAGDDGFLMFALPSPTADENAEKEAPSEAHSDANDTAADISGNEDPDLHEVRGSGKNKMMLKPPSAEGFIEEYAPDFAGKAQQVVIIQTASPITNRPDASETVTGEGYSAFLIDADPALITNAEELATELGGARYGEPGTPMVWIEIYE